MGLDIILFSVLAVFVFIKLRNTLGKVDEEIQHHATNIVNNKNEVITGEVVESKQPEVDKEFDKLTDGKIKSALLEMKKIDASFSVSGFLVGAKKAFEIVLDGFSQNKKEAMQGLVSDDLYKAFAQNIDSNKLKGEYEASELVAIEKAEIIDSSIKKSLGKAIALIKIKFVSEQTLLTKNNKGEKVSGKGVENFTAEDEWLFQKDLNSSNPNWQIIATS